MSISFDHTKLTDEKYFLSIVGSADLIEQTTTIKDITRTNCIAVKVDVADKYRFDAAFQEFFRNSGMKVDWNTGALVITDDFVCYNPEPIKEIDECIYYTTNGYWRCWWYPLFDMSGPKEKVAGGIFLLEWKLRGYGYWSNPGIQIYRCLGQELRVGLITVCITEPFDTFDDEEQEALDRLDEEEE